MGTEFQFREMKRALEIGGRTRMYLSVHLKTVNVVNSVLCVFAPQLSRNRKLAPPAPLQRGRDRRADTVKAGASQRYASSGYRCSEDAARWRAPVSRGDVREDVRMPDGGLRRGRYRDKAGEGGPRLILPLHPAFGHGPGQATAGTGPPPRLPRPRLLPHGRGQQLLV